MNLYTFWVQPIHLVSARSLHELTLQTYQHFFKRKLVFCKYNTYSCGTRIINQRRAFSFLADSILFQECDSSLVSGICPSISRKNLCGYWFSGEPVRVAQELKISKVSCTLSLLLGLSKDAKPAHCYVIS